MFPVSGIVRELGATAVLVALLVLGVVLGVDAYAISSIVPGRAGPGVGFRIVAFVDELCKTVTISQVTENLTVI